MSVLFTNASFVNLELLRLLANCNGRLGLVSGHFPQQMDFEGYNHFIREDVCYRCPNNVYLENVCGFIPESDLF